MKKKFILAIFIILIIIFLVYIFYPKKCDDFLEIIEGMVGYSQGSFESELENTLSEICDYSVDSRYDNTTFVTFTFCDLDKVKNGLNNPESLTLSEIRAYIKASDTHSVGQGYVFLKDIYEDDFYICEPVKLFSAEIYHVLYISGLSSVYLYKTGLISTCLREDSNLTEVEERDCVINVLNAEKAAVDHYLNLDYERDIKNCVLSKRSFDYKGEPLIPNLFRSSLCRNFFNYRKKLVEKVKESDIDYNQKFFIVASLYQQDIYLNFGESSQDTREYFYQIIQRGVDPKYRDLFKAEF